MKRRRYIWQSRRWRMIRRLNGFEQWQDKINRVRRMHTLYRRKRR